MTCWKSFKMSPFLFMSSFSFNGADSTVVVNWPKTEMVIRLLQFFALLVWRFELVACVGGDFISHISAKHIHVHSYSSRFFPHNGLCAEARSSSTNCVLRRKSLQENQESPNFLMFNCFFGKCPKYFTFQQFIS